MARRKDLGRPTLSDGLTEKIVVLVQVGVPPKVAAGANGVDEATFDWWMELGEANGKGYWRQRRFWQAVKKAEAQFETALVTAIRQAESWQAKAWLAERRFPEKYVRRSVNSDDIKPAPGPTPFDDLDVESNVRPLRPRRSTGS